MLFGTSPMYPIIQSVEDLPLKTPGGHRNLELRSTDEEPLSTAAARRVLERPAGQLRLLASKVTRRRIPTASPQKPSEHKGLEEDFRSLKDTLAGLITRVSGLESKNSELQSQVSVLESRNTDLYTRVSVLEAHNVDLYAPLLSSRSLATTNMLQALLRTFDQALSYVIRALQDTPLSHAQLHALVSDQGPWPRQTLGTLTYSRLWWFLYNQTIYDPQVPIEVFWSSTFGCDVPAPPTPASNYAFPVVRSQVLRDTAELVVKPILMEPVENIVLGLLDFNNIGCIQLRSMIGCFISIFQQHRNQNIHMFEQMLGLDSRSKMLGAVVPTPAQLLRLNESLSHERLSALQKVLSDILGHLDDMTNMLALKPLVQCMANRLKVMCDMELQKPLGWTVSAADAQYWMSPDGYYCMHRLTGRVYIFDYVAQEWVEHLE